MIGKQNRREKFRLIWFGWKFSFFPLRLSALHTNIMFFNYEHSVSFSAWCCFNLVRHFYRAMFDHLKVVICCCCCCCFCFTFNRYEKFICCRMSVFLVLLSSLFHKHKYTISNENGKRFDSDTVWIAYVFFLLSSESTTICHYRFKLILKAWRIKRCGFRAKRKN